MASSVVLQNVKYVDETCVDIVIEDTKIRAITKPGQGKAQHVIDCSDHYVSSGWIDMHVHALKELDPYGDDIDEIGVNLGVTTIVDAGSCGTDQIGELIARGKKSKTKLFTFLNTSQIGLKQSDELSNLDWIHAQDILKCINQYPDDIIGIKVRMSKSVIGENGLTPLLMAKEIANQASLPLMVHVGSSPPNIREILPILQKRDIVTHFLNGKPNRLFKANGEAFPEVIDAVSRGVQMDVGHGTESFSFEVAEQAKKQGIYFDTISTDIYRQNRTEGPVYNMAHTLTKFIHLGYSLKEVIDGVTVHAANWLDKPELDCIQVGEKAILTLFSMSDKPILLTDSDGVSHWSKQTIIAKGVVMNGEVIIY